VAGPVEQQVNGTENLLRAVSRCTNDGKYVLTLTFKPGTDIDIAQVLVQNRVSLSLPVVPAAVQNEGITVKKRGPLLMLVTLTSPNGRHNDLYLSNYATTEIIDELGRVAGVGEVMGIGQQDTAMRVWLDPEKLAARNITATDVVKAIAAQNVKVAAGKIGEAPAPKGQQFQLTIETMGRLIEPDKFGDIILKAGADAQAAIVYLKDVAKIELGAKSPGNYVSFNGKPAVALGIYPTGGTTPKEVSKAVTDKLAALRKALPADLSLDVAFDYSPNLEAANQKTSEYLLLDLQLPATASAERVGETLARCGKLLRDMKGVQDVLALNESPFDTLRNQPCMLVALEPAEKRKMTRQELKWAIRDKFEKIPAVALRVRDLSRADSSSTYCYPVEFTVSGQDASKVQQLAEKLGERLQKTKLLTDVWVNQDSKPRPCLYMEIDRTKVKALGVDVKDVFETLQVFLGSMYVNDFNEFGRTWQVIVSAENVKADAEDLLKLQVRNNQGKMVRLSTFTGVRTTEGPAVILRVDTRPAVLVSANPVASQTAAQARTLTEAQFEEARKELRLPNGYRLTWLQANQTEK
jgi:multidrug efflux pump subunit AcrB